MNTFQLKKIIAIKPSQIEVIATLKNKLTSYK